MENEYLLVALIILFGSFTQGFAGFGFQLISVSLLTLFFNPKEVIPVCALFGLSINIILAIQLRIHIRIKEIIPLLIGAVFGIPLGLVFLKFASIDLLKISIGLILILFVISSSGSFFSYINLNSKFAYLFGLLSGFLGGAINANGPPVIIYLLIKKFEDNKFKAAITIFFLFSSVMIVFGHLMAGFTTLKSLQVFAEFLPIILIGNFIGIYVYSKISNNVFKRSINLLLLLIAIKLLFI